MSQHKTDLQTPCIADATVDLGQSLIMLAIHDIGELITGDEMTFTKKASAKDPEYAAALSLVDTSYHEIYDDVETQGSTGRSALCSTRNGQLQDLAG